MPDPNQRQITPTKRFNGDGVGSGTGKCQLATGNAVKAKTRAETRVL